MRKNEDTDLLVERARDAAPVRPPVAEKERRYVFNGDPQARIAGYAVRPNRRAIRRTRSTFNIIVVLFGIGVVIVLYVSNILAVNQLAHEVNTLQTRYAKLVNANQLLSAELDRKSTLDRIGKIAAEQLGLKYAKEQPAWLEVDEDELRRITTP